MTKTVIPRIVFCLGIASCLVIVGIFGCASRGEQPPAVTTAPEATPPAAEPLVDSEPAPEPQSEPGREVVSVTAHRLNLRAENSAESRILGVLEKKDSLIVLGRKGSWINVQTGSGKEGWVSARYTTAQGEPQDTTTSAAVTTTTITTTSTTTTTMASTTTTVAATTAGQAPPARAVFTQADAVALYNQYRQTLAEGDFEAFVECLYVPGKPDGPAEQPALPTPDEFTQMKDLILELNPDLSTAKILKFDSNAEAAILVARTNLDDSAYITLSALKFAADDGKWGVMSKFHDDTFPRENPTADEEAIQKALEENEDLQLAMVVAQAKELRTPKPKASEDAAVTDDSPPALEEGEAGKTEKAATEPPAEDDAASRVASVYNDSPKHRAIVSMLEAEGETEMMQTATSVGIISEEDFARATIGYMHAGQSVAVDVYLLKKNDIWTAHREFPVHENHPVVFLALAERYCASRYEDFQGAEYHDDSWRGEDRQKRTINLVCAEVVDGQWREHRMGLVYEYDADEGWHITGGQAVEAFPPEGEVSAETATQTDQDQKVPATDEQAFSDEVVDRFFQSILAGDGTAVKDFLAEGMSPNVQRPRLGGYPLHTAVFGRQDQIALMLLEAGSDARLKDKNGVTPLLYAAGNCKSIALVKALVAAGADVNAKAKGGGTPLMLAEAMQCEEIIQILREAGAE